MEVRLLTGQHQRRGPEQRLGQLGHAHHQARQEGRDLSQAFRQRALRTTRVAAVAVVVAAAAHSSRFEPRREVEAVDVEPPTRDVVVGVDVGSTFHQKLVDVEAAKEGVVLSEQHYSRLLCSVVRIKDFLNRMKIIKSVPK